MLNAIAFQPLSLAVLEKNKLRKSTAYGLFPVATVVAVATGPSTCVIFSCDLVNSVQGQLCDLSKSVRHEVLKWSHQVSGCWVEGLDSLGPWRPLRSPANRCNDVIRLTFLNFCHLYRSPVVPEVPAVILTITLPSKWHQRMWTLEPDSLSTDTSFALCSCVTMDKLFSLSVPPLPSPLH